MDDNTDAKRILSTLLPEDWTRPRRRPRITWLSTIQQDLRSHNLTLPEAMDMAHNRSLWTMWSMYYSDMQSRVACQNHHHHHIYFRLPERPQKPIELATMKQQKENCKNQKIQKGKKMI